MSVRREKGSATVETITAALEGLDGVQAKVGWFETARYPNGTPVAYVATIHEFGAPSAGIPPRPFMRPTVAAQGQAWIDLMGQGAKAALAGSMSAHDVLDLVAQKAAGDVGKAISQVSAPPLKPATVKRKGNDKPLVETGQMIQSVTGKVEAAGDE